MIVSWSCTMHPQSRALAIGGTMLKESDDHVLLAVRFDSKMTFDFLSSAVGRHLKLLDRVVGGASFLSGRVFECDLAHRCSVAVLCMLYKIWCNPMQNLYGALPVPYVPVRVTCVALIAYLFTYAPPRCRTSQYHMTFILMSVSLWNDLGDIIFDGVGLAGFKSRVYAFLFA